MNDTAHTDIDLIDVDTDDCPVESWPSHFGYSVTVPVTVELPTEIVADCRQEFDYAQAHGRDVDFVEYLWDVLEIEPTFTVEGQEIDMETGLKVE